MVAASGRTHVVILAGGSGTRFWPLSRAEMPKQMLRILGDHSMFAVTLQRAQALVPEKRIWVVTTVHQAGGIRRELHTLGLPEVRVLEEPLGRNTAAAIGLAAFQIIHEDPHAILAVFPADHHIQSPKNFLHLLHEGSKIADAGWLVTLGIKPTRPETGYGYVQRGHAMKPQETGRTDVDVFRVKRFAEKPDRDTANRFILSGDYYWNSGVFMWRADRFLEEMARHLPEHHRALREIADLPDMLRRVNSRGRGIYGSLEAISVDYGILERTDRAALIPADMGWSDVGSWAALREILSKDADGNVLLGDVFALDTRESLVRSEERLVATLGLNGLVVVETGDAILVCPEDRSQAVREIADQLRAQGREEALLPREVPKPWGAYRVLDRASRYQVKWLDVLPGERLSLQSHAQREEDWIVVAGTATVTVDESEEDLCCGEHIHIPRGSRHRLENRGKERLRVIEVQTGEYLGEDDIIRYEDEYGRV